MSNVYSTLTSEGLEESTDVLGGRHVFDTNIYNATVKAAYSIESSGGALGIALVLATSEGDYNETIYVTNRNKQNFYLNANKKKCPLPGFTLINDLCLIANGKPLSEQDFQEKSLKVWDYDTKDEVVKPVLVAVDLIGAKVAVAITKQLVNKKVKSGNEYVDSNETVEENRINKLFDLDTHLTVHEAKTKSEAKFYDKWLDKYQNTVADKVKKGIGSVTANKDLVKPKRSLFGE